MTPQGDRVEILGIPLPGSKLPLNAYLVEPSAPAPSSGVVVIHELFGLNNNIRDIARRFAGAGYAALVCSWPVWTAPFGRRSSTARTAPAGRRGPGVPDRRQLPGAGLHRQGGAAEIDAALKVFADLLPRDLIKPPVGEIHSTGQALAGITEIGSKGASN